MNAMIVCIKYVFHLYSIHRHLTPEKRNVSILPLALIRDSLLRSICFIPAGRMHFDDEIDRALDSTSDLQYT